MDEINSVGPERDAADRDAAEIFLRQNPAGSPGQEQSEAKRHESEAKGAREIRVVTESQLAPVDFPKREVHRQEKCAAGERGEELVFAPELGETERDPRGKHAEHERIEAIDHDHALRFRPDGGRIVRGDHSRASRKGEEGESGGEKNAIEPARHF